MSEQPDILSESVSENNGGGILSSFFNFAFMLLLGATAMGGANHLPEEYRPYLQDNHIGVLNYAEFCTVLATIFVCINLTKWLITVIKWIRSSFKSIKSYFKSKRKKKMFDHEKHVKMGGNPGTGSGGSSSSGGGSSAPGGGGGGGHEEEQEKQD